MAGGKRFRRPILAALILCGALLGLYHLTFVGTSGNMELLEDQGSQVSSAGGIVAAVAAIVLVSRASDACYLSRLFFDAGSTDGTNMLSILASSLLIMGYEQLVGSILKALNLTKLPTTLMAMIALFVTLRGTQKILGRQASDAVCKVFNPGVEFLGKWMGLFLAPPLVFLDASIRRLPAYSAGVWIRTLGLLIGCWSLQHAVAGAVGSAMVKGRSPPAGKNKNLNPAATVAATAATKQGSTLVTPDEAVRRAWVILGAVGYLGVVFAPLTMPALHRPCAMLAELSTTIASMAYAKLLPGTVQRILHPIVACAVITNMCTSFVGPAAPYFDEGAGVGDFLFKWLGPAVTGLGVRMYQNTPLWLDDIEDFKCVMGTCAVSAMWNLMMMTFLAVHQLSPLGVPAPLSLPLVNRSVMSALGIANSEVIGPECDPKLAVASILITGCIGASLGGALIKAAPSIFRAEWPLVRGIAMGCSAHSIGTAGLISEQDNEAAAIAGASMCVHGAMHTALIAIPLVVTTLRALAQLE